MAKLATLVIFLLIPLILVRTIFAVTIFSENFESGTLSGWSSSGGGATATASQEAAHNGSYSIKVSHDKTSSYGYQITIQNIEPGMFYEGSAYGKSQDSSLNAFFVRVAWYSTIDASGSQLSTPSDSNQGASGSDWTQLSTGAIQAPSNANSAKLRLVLTSKTSGQLANAYYDDVLFKEAVAPMPSPSPSPSPNPSPSPSPLKSPSPSPTALPKSPWPSPLKSQAPTPPVLGQSTQSATPSASPSPAPTSSPENFLDKIKNNSKTALILVGSGLILIGLSSAFYLWYSKLLGKDKIKNPDDEKDD